MSYPYPVSRDLPISTEIVDPVLKRMTEALLSSYEGFDGITLSANKDPKSWMNMKEHRSRVAWFGARLARLLNLPQAERDILLSACQLHDISHAILVTKERNPDACQRLYPTGYNRSEQAYKNHPMVSSFIIGRYILENKLWENGNAVRVAKVVSCHMGNWFPETSPRPTDLLDQLLSIADYFGSREEIEIPEAGGS